MDETTHRKIFRAKYLIKLYSQPAPDLDKKVFLSYKEIDSYLMSLASELHYVTLVLAFFTGNNTHHLYWSDVKVHVRNRFYCDSYT